MFYERIEKVKSRIQELEIEALLIVHIPNIRYLTGYTGDEGTLLLSNDEVFLIVDSRYTEQAITECKGIKVVEPKQAKEGLIETLNEIINSKCIERVGFEKRYMPYYLYKMLTEKISQVRWIETEDIVEEIRSVKNEEEIKLIREAVKIAEEALKETLELISTKLDRCSEMDIAAELEYKIKTKGADDIASSFIIVSGEKTAWPHGKPSHRKLKNGGFLTIDFGAMVKGYRCDITRTFGVGKISEEERRIYETVKKAQLEALERIKEGVPIKEIDLLVKKIFESYSYRQYFRHGLGHGVGLEIHEKPFISEFNNSHFQEHNVITIEPGVYIPGLCGVRIEDTIVVEKDKIKNLVSFPKDLMIL